MSPKCFAVLLPAFAAVLGLSNLSAQTSDDKLIFATAAAARFGPAANAPDCFTISVERGDPSKGASVILAKFAPACVAPFHWHTPSETVMIVSGALEIQMKGDNLWWHIAAISPTCLASMYIAQRAPARPRASSA